MIKIKQTILLIIGLTLFQTTFSQNENQIDWNNDLDYLSRELAEKHYNLFTVKSKDDFLSGIDAIKKESKDLTDFQTALKTQQLIAACGDSHTMLGFSQLIDKDQILPIHLHWFNDGLYILYTTSENEKLLGSELLSINKTPIANIIDSLSSIFTIDNQATVKIAVPQVISSLQILKHFGFANSDQVELEIKTRTNQKQMYVLNTSEMNANNIRAFRPDSMAFCTQNEKQFFTDVYYPAEKIYYMLYNRCWSKEIEQIQGNKETAESLPSFLEFEEKAFNVLKDNPVDKIIFDLRYNGGGNSLQGTEFINKLAEFVKKNPSTKTYVILGRNTFSSAILNAMDFKNVPNTIFVGEETHGKPNHFGEVRGFQLPDSKLYVNYSTKYFKKTEENVNTLTPDVTIETSFSDYTKGIDPVYEWIKQQ